MGGDACKPQCAVMRSVGGQGFGWDGSSSVQIEGGCSPNSLADHSKCMKQTPTRKEGMQCWPTRRAWWGVNHRRQSVCVVEEPENDRLKWRWQVGTGAGIISVLSPAQQHGWNFPCCRQREEIIQTGLSLSQAQREL